MVARVRTEVVWSAFRHDAPYLFLGAAFVAVGIVSAAFAVHRRKRESLLVFFALFATLYGLRLWICSSLLAMAEQDSIYYIRLRGAIDYVLLIPAFLFFISLGRPRRFERGVAYAVVALGAVLAAATLLSGNAGVYERMNSIAVIGASGFFLIRFMVRGSTGNRGLDAADFAVLRWGLLTLSFS